MPCLFWVPKHSSGFCYATHSSRKDREHYLVLLRSTHQSEAKPSSCQSKTLCFGYPVRAVYTEAAKYLVPRSKGQVCVAKTSIVSQRSNPAVAVLLRCETILVLAVGTKQPKGSSSQSKPTAGVALATQP